VARPKTTEMVSVRLPIGTLAKLQKLADDKGMNRCRYIISTLVSVAQAPTAQDLESDLAEAFTFGEENE
jgi:hypothetical protein